MTSDLNVFSLAEGYRNLLLTGIASVGTGNAFDNRIKVNQLTVHNTLYGLAGQDTLEGGDGDDKLIGGAGNDSMDGGFGSDVYLIDRADEHSRAEINDTGIGLALPVPTAPSNVDEVRFAATSLLGGATLTIFAGDLGLETVTIALDLELPPIAVAAWV